MNLNQHIWGFFANIFRIESGKLCLSKDDTVVLMSVDKIN